MSGSKANALVHALYGKVVGDVIAKSRVRCARRSCSARAAR
jgi:hypothetical protein